jgi:hypothetical protein
VCGEHQPQRAEKATALDKIHTSLLAWVLRLIPRGAGHSRAPSARWQRAFQAFFTKQAFRPMETPSILQKISWSPSTKTRRPTCRLSTTIRLGFSRAESAHHKNDQADQQNETKASATNDGTTKVKTAAAEQEKQNKDQQ